MSNEQQKSEERPIPHILPEDVKKINSPSRNSQLVAKLLHGRGFDVVPLGAVRCTIKMCDSEEHANSYIDACVLAVGGVVLERSGDDKIRVEHTLPGGPTGEDISRHPAVKNWRSLPFEPKWWESGCEVPLPEGWSDFGKRRDGKPITRYGDDARNIGIRTGNGLLVIDIDRKKGRDGFQELKNLFGADWQKWFPPTLSIITPSKGLHLYYRYSKDVNIKNSVSVIAPAVDVRADGGLIVAPGSVGLNGNLYRIDKWPEIAELPQETIDMIILGKKKVTRTRPGAVRKKSRKAKKPTASKEQALAKVLRSYPQVQSGTRHSTLVSVAGKLRNLLRSDDDLEWSYRAFAAARGIDDRDKVDLERILQDAKTKFSGAPATPNTTFSETPAAPTTTKKKSILVTTDEAGVIRELEPEVAKLEWLFSRATRIVRVSSGELGAPSIQMVTADGLASLTTDVVDWARVKDEEKVDCHPPRWAIAGLLASPQLWESIRKLDGIVEYPVLRPDGSVMMSAGYDAKLRLVLTRPGSSTFPENPSHDDAVQAAKDILEPMCDFPFASDVDRAVFVAALLTPLVRYADVGNVPLFVVDKNTRGAGGSLLVDVIGTILTGRAPPRVPESASEEEMRKRITSLLMAGDAFVLFDNISRPLGGPALDALLTGSVWRDRLLGSNELTLVPNRATFFATGNNVELGADTVRRTLRIRLESAEEHPEDRTGYKYPRLIAHILATRDLLLVAALTILRAYCVAGRPRTIEGQWGSFEGWTELVAQAVVWCGLANPLDARVSRDESSDREKGEWAGVLEDLCKMGAVADALQASDILKLIDREATSYPRAREYFADRNGKLLTAAKIGMKLRKARERVVNGMKLTSMRNGANKGLWRVEILVKKANHQEKWEDAGELHAVNESESHVDPDLPRATAANDFVLT